MRGGILILGLQSIFGKVLGAHAAGRREEINAKDFHACNDEAGEVALPGNEGGQHLV